MYKQIAGVSSPCPVHPCQGLSVLRWRVSAGAPNYFISVHGLALASFSVLLGVQWCSACSTAHTLSLPRGIHCIPKHRVIHWCIYTTLAGVFNAMNDYQYQILHVNTSLQDILVSSFSRYHSTHLTDIFVSILWVDYQREPNVKITRQNEVSHTQYFSCAA